MFVVLLAPVAVTAVIYGGASIRHFGISWDLS